MFEENRNRIHVQFTVAGMPVRLPVARDKETQMADLLNQTSMLIVVQGQRVLVAPMHNKHLCGVTAGLAGFVETDSFDFAIEQLIFCKYFK